jgi:hypothetical protein
MHSSRSSLDVIINGHTVERLRPLRYLSSLAKRRGCHEQRQSFVSMHNFTVIVTVSTNSAERFWGQGGSPVGLRLQNLAFREFSCGPVKIVYR